MGRKQLPTGNSTRPDADELESLYHALVKKFYDEGDGGNC
jgi:hypothetical protein